MTDPRTIAEHGSRIIAALEHAWAAIQGTHPDVPDVVIVTGAGSNQKGTPEGYQLRGHHRPEDGCSVAGTSRAPLSYSSLGSCWPLGAGRWWR